jgi:ATP-dependent Lhr-like helicase
VIQRWIWERGWTEFHEVQEEAASPILEGDRDVIITAATAGGKTEAAFLPILTRVAEHPSGSVRVLYVSPLKALINDQFDRLSDLGQRLDIPVHRWHGDASASEKKKLLEHPSGVLLITPESLEALFVLRGTQMPRVLNGLEFVVVDELHAFIGAERGRHLQSLLHRVDRAAGRRIPRIALSATLGDMSLAAEFLRPGDGSGVLVISSTSTSHELKMLLRGFRKGAPRLVPKPDNPEDVEEEDSDEDEIAIAEHLFVTLRGSKNLVFANSRRNVEMYADRLRRLCEESHLPQEFWAHHGSLAKEYREDAERALKDGTRPNTVVCTTTLELGIDIGSVKSVAQVGPPPSVASLRQRLGRSGRRGEPAILRFYIGELELNQDVAPQDALRVQLCQSVAMVRLLLGRWYEPPSVGMLHLSTLLQQVLSLVAERGGITAASAFDALCRTGPFRDVDSSMFVSLLKGMGKHDLIIQTQEGLLVLGVRGERLVNHYSFYSVFVTPDEYRLVQQGRTIGTLPVTQPLQPEMHIIFGGRRWMVQSIDEQQKVIYLVPSPGGKVPLFSGSVAQVHDRVRREMFLVYQEESEPEYLDKRALELLKEGRDSFRRFGLAEASILPYGREVLCFCWTGDRVVNTLQVQLTQRGLRVARSGLTLSVANTTRDSLIEHLRDLREAGQADPQRLAAAVCNLAINKYDLFLSPELLAADYAARELDTVAAHAYLCGLPDLGAS